MVDEGWLFRVKLSLSVSLCFLLRWLVSPLLLPKCLAPKWVWDTGSRGWVESFPAYTCVHIHKLLAPRTTQNGLWVRKVWPENRLWPTWGFCPQSPAILVPGLPQASSVGTQTYSVPGPLLFPAFLDQKFFLLCNRNHYSEDTKDRKKGIWAQVDSHQVTLREFRFPILPSKAAGTLNPSSSCHPGSGMSLFPPWHFRRSDVV